MPKYCLFITPFFSPNIGGVETHFDDLLSLSGKYGKNFIVSAYQPLNTEKSVQYLEKKDGNLIYRLPWLGKDLFRKLERHPALEVLYLAPGLLVQSLCLLFKHRKSIAVVHSQGFIAGLICTILSMFVRRRTVFTDHTVYGMAPGSRVARVFAFICNRHDIVLAVSELARQELVSWGVPAEKIRIFRYWSDTSRFIPRPKGQVRRELGLDVDKKILVNVARMDPAKGLDILAATADLVLKKRQDVVFYLISSAKNEEQFLRFIGRDKLPANCHFIGRVDYQKLDSWYCAADCLLVTSRKEGYSRVVIESLLCGTPVIGSRTGSLVDVLNEAVAFYVDEVSAEGFAKGILQVFGTTGGLDKKRQEAITYSRKHFTEANASAIFDSYDN